jgi:hypothetical protein
LCFQAIDTFFINAQCIFAKGTGIAPLIDKSFNIDGEGKVLDIGGMGFRLFRI